MRESISETMKEEQYTVPTEGFIQIYESLQAELFRVPCRYIGFIKTYFHIMNRKKQALAQRKNMLLAGVEALRRARSEVATLKAQAAEQEAALSDKQESANRALEQIAATVRANTDQREEMHTLKANIEAENEKLQIRKKEIEVELASVEPVIAAARAAVGDIRPESLSEIRSLRAPPDVVRDVLEGVLRLMGIADTSWHSMKNFLSKRGVKEDIRCLDASQIRPEAVESVERLLSTRGASFEQATAKRASAACAPLAAWVRANLAYAAALARIQPLQAQQTLLHRNLQAAKEQLNALSTGLASVEERVASLQQQLGQHTRDAATLELKLNTAQSTIAAASGLIGTLAAEYDAWEIDLENISKEILQLNHRSLLAAAYIVFLPDVTEPQAREYLKKWSELIGFEDSSFSVPNFLASTEKQLKWQTEGLPSDSSAIKNAVLIDQALEAEKCGFTPLVIDPDGEATAWLKTSLADTPCDFVSQQSQKLLTAVQYAVRLKRVLIITDVEGVHWSWAGLLEEGARLVVIGRAAPSFPPTIAARISPIYAAAGRDSLTDQLVHYALQQLNPEVNKKSKEIKLKKAALQKQQHELQENLLSVLSTNSDILHDANLLASLNKTRKTSTTISEALEAANAIECDIRATSEAYRPSAARTALLALTVKSLTSHRPLVALPIDVVLDIFVDALHRSDANGINNDEVMKYITRRVIERVLLSLHKKDKYKIVLHILKQVYDDIIPDKLWQVFLGNYICNEDQTTVNDIKNTIKWISDDLVKKIAQLKVINEELFIKLKLQDAELWKQFLDSGDLNTLSPLSFTPCELIVAVSILRPDSTYRAIVNLVDYILGAGVMSSGSGGAGVSLAGRWSMRRPALLLAAHALDVLAQHARSLALVGVEDGRLAWEAAVDAARSGGWVALIVGASPFTQDLRNFIIDFVQRPTEDFNEEFRLWIVSEDREIPTIVANMCVNVILEAPEGVKHNVTSTLSAWGELEEDGTMMRARACLALFHAIVQERRSYIPQGWSRWYGWEWGEISACAGALSGSSSSGGRALVLALYGARAGAADRRPLAALHRATLGEHALAHCWRPLGLTLPLPAPTTTRSQAYLSAFDAFPNIDPPQLLGLPDNCRVAWERNAAHDIVVGLKELNTTAVNTNKNNLTPLKMILTLWKKYMAGSSLIKADYKFEKGATGWWASACACEAAAAACGARSMHRALGLHSRYGSLHKTPEEWQSWWTGPEESSVYIREFCHRALAAEARMRTLTSDMPKEVDLRSLLFPGRVVWAARAHAAMRLKCRIHQLTLLAKWAPRPDEREEDGLVVLGLHIAGARWSGGGLAAAGARDAPRAPAPSLLLRYVLQNQAAPLSPEGTVEVPVYSSETREEELFVVRAPLAKPFDRETAEMHAVALIIAPLE